jgi:hypothetical protein
MKDSPNTNYVKPNIPIGQREVIHGIGDSLLVGLSFYFGFLITSLWSHSPSSPYIGQGELVLMSLGAAFSYAFVFVFRWDRHPASIGTETKMLTIPFWNITYAYLLHLSILFLVKDAGFSSVRGAVGLGYVLGFLSLIVNGFLFQLISPPTREGGKKIIFRGVGKAVESALSGINHISSPVEFHIKQDTPRSEIMGHLDRLKGYDLKIVVDDRTENAFSDDTYLVRK